MPGWAGEENNLVQLYGRDYREPFGPVVFRFVVVVDVGTGFDEDGAEMAGSVRRNSDVEGVDSGVFGGIELAVDILRLESFGSYAVDNKTIDEVELAGNVLGLIPDVLILYRIITAECRDSPIDSVIVESGLLVVVVAAG